MCVKLDCSPYRAGRLAAEADKFGSVLSKSELPYTDLVVREAIQNSLDAASSAFNIDFVAVDFRTGKFDSARLQQIFGENDTRFDQVEEKEERKRFLAIRDQYTTGLDGDYWDKQSNFYKLVYGFNTGKGNELQGAGGSFGLGKTVFCKVGLGLVIYYSRFKKEESFEERLIIFYCQSTDSSLFREDLLPEKIGWWGRNIDENDPDKNFAPLTDPEKIGHILDIFQIETYKNKETGTTIIIPFTNEAKQLEYTQKSSGENAAANAVFPIWHKDLRSYLEYAVLKWYAPRIKNPLGMFAEEDTAYPFGKKLICSFHIDGQPYPMNTDSDQYRFFSKIRDMYNVAWDDSIPFDETLQWDLDATADEIKKIKIQLNNLNKEKIFWNEYSVGTLVVLKVTNPCCVLNDLCSENQSLMLYCRQPGMLVRYSTNDDWSAALRPICANGKDYKVIGLFVVNSSQDAILSYGEPSQSIRIEELFRNIEGPDHHSWEKYTKPTIGYTQLDIQISQRVINNIYNTLRKSFSREITGTERADSISNFLGQFFAPCADSKNNFPEGNSPAGKEKEPGKSTRRSFKKTKIEFFQPQYSTIVNNVTVTVPCKIIVNPEQNTLWLNFEVITDNTRYHWDSWKKNFNNTEYPIQIRGVEGADAEQLNFQITRNQLKITLPQQKIELKKLNLVYSLSRRDVSCVILREKK